jgi:hypothetical protein
MIDQTAEPTAVARAGTGPVVARTRPADSPKRVKEI